ncbi:hypothetical protein [Desulfoscipio gibsoniae]|uniref:Uncharacterized protein n=1 Tax=Desulfoscipio gibsoniae DSM 7213 TaxID=767817 RepID=R4KKM7_9FIRM|nr:hypothetical protein [Desulfoscipio gibsoniae]AGL01060.1 hypothetical protein Desgi_1579 [Desulfoscipio gibsoniae DSM 7213]
MVDNKGNHKDTGAKNTIQESLFGLQGDYMTAGLAADLDESNSPQLLPGRARPPKPLDDRKKGDISLGELLKEEVGDIVGDD